MMIAEIPGDIEGDDKEGAPGLEDLGEVEKRGIFAIVGHLGAEHTLKALSLGGHDWTSMRRDVTRLIYLNVLYVSK